MSEEGTHRPVELLLVEDNPADVRLTKEAFKEVTMPSNLHVAVDGVEAMDFLRGTGQFDNAPRPDVIILDLNLPRMDGREVLKEIRADDALCDIVVFILTTSNSPDDIKKTSKLGANGYIVKPINYQEFIQRVKQLVATIRFWMVLKAAEESEGE